MARGSEEFIEDEGDEGEDGDEAGGDEKGVDVGDGPEDAADDGEERPGNCNESERDGEADL